MNGDKRDGSTSSLSPVALFRGVYKRVAKRLGVDPSYVSRVARGERQSAEVEKALAEEVRLIRDHLNNHHGAKDGDGAFHDGHALDGHRPAPDHHKTARLDGAVGSSKGKTRNSPARKSPNS